MTRSRRLLLAAFLLGPALAGCGAAARPEPLPAPAPEVVLTAEDRDAWRAPPPSAGEVPVLLYHGLGGREAFASRADAYYGLEREDFAKQLALLDHAGYEAITLAQFRAFHAGDEVALPDHPVLLTFDDAREDAWLGADAVLARHGWSAVMFVDVGAVAAGGERSTRVGTSSAPWTGAAAGSSSSTRVAGTARRSRASLPPSCADARARLRAADDPRAARPHDVLVPRLQLTRAMAGGDLRAWLAAA